MIHKFEIGIIKYKNILTNIQKISIDKPICIKLRNQPMI